MTASPRSLSPRRARITTALASVTLLLSGGIMPVAGWDATARPAAPGPLRGRLPAHRPPPAASLSFIQLTLTARAPVLGSLGAP